MLKLSIIVPIYNVEAYVDRCFYSLCNQNLDKECYEIVAINDGTPDSSMQIVEKYACAYSNVCIVNQINQGVSVARNNGIKRSTGNYLLFVDPDDWIAPDSLKSIYDYLLSHSDIEVLFLKSICSSNNREYCPMKGICYYIFCTLKTLKPIRNRRKHTFIYIFRTHFFKSLMRHNGYSIQR